MSLNHSPRKILCVTAVVLSTPMAYAQTDDTSSGNVQVQAEENLGADASANAENSTAPSGDASIASDVDTTATQERNASPSLDRAQNETTDRSQPEDNQPAVNSQQQANQQESAAKDSQGVSQVDRNAPWRFKRHNGEWWYWTPSNAWMYHRNGRWNRYDSNTFVRRGQVNPRRRYTTGYRGPQPFYQRDDQERNYYLENGSRYYIDKNGTHNWYDGERVYRPNNYYRDPTGRRFYYQDGRRYYYDDGGRYYFDGRQRVYDRYFYNDPRISDPGFRRGAGIGGAIGGAIGGDTGADTGAAIGGAVGRGQD